MQAKQNINIFASERVQALTGIDCTFHFMHVSPTEKMWILLKAMHDEELAGKRRDASSIPRMHKNVCWMGKETNRWLVCAKARAPKCPL